jgi:hypothetical protein
VIKLHPDFPQVELPVGEPEYGYWHLPTPLDDIATALAYESSAQKAATPMPSDLEHRILIGDLAEVVRYRIKYHDEVWTPGGNAAGSELSMALVARTTSGEWLSIEAWNDYTGWGCQDGADVRVGGTEEQVVKYGLTVEARTLLGYPAGQVTA